MPAAGLAAISPLPVIRFSENHVSSFPIKIRGGRGFWPFFLVRFLHKKTPSGENGVLVNRVQVTTP